jgi:hypothetical protein
MDLPLPTLQQYLYDMHLPHLSSLCVRAAAVPVLRAGRSRGWSLRLSWKLQHVPTNGLGNRTCGQLLSCQPTSSLSDVGWNQTMPDKVE